MARRTFIPGLSWRKQNEIASLLSLSRRQKLILQCASISDIAWTIMGHFARGSNTKQIAEIMGRSPKTVEWHRAHLYINLGITQIAGLTRFAIRAKAISAEE